MVMLSTEPIVLARIALARLGLVGKGNERDRRPTQDELDRMVAAFEANRFQQIPVGRIVRFAVATAMRQDEICRIEWRISIRTKRCSSSGIGKIPKKFGNNQRIPLLNVTGYDACASSKNNAPALTTAVVAFSLQWPVGGYGVPAPVS